MTLHCFALRCLPDVLLCRESVASRRTARISKSINKGVEAACPPTL